MSISQFYPLPASLEITDSTPDTTGPVLDSVFFSVASASVDDYVEVYAYFSDPETRILDNWGTSVDTGDPAGTWYYNIDWSYDSGAG